MESSRNDLGYPKSQVDAPLFQLFTACGGSGVTRCAELMGSTQYVYSVRVPKFVVFNRSLILNNGTYDHVGIFSDAGPIFLCDHSRGTRQDFWVALSVDGVLTDLEVESRGVLIASSNIPPYNIEFDWNKIPQPTNPAWQNRIYVHIHWASPLYVTDNPMHEDILTLTKHDYDIKQ